MGSLRRSLISLHRALKSSNSISPTETLLRPQYGYGLVQRSYSISTTSNLDIDLSNQESKRRLFNRLIYRSKQRGFLELDLVLGKWVEEHIHSMDENGIKSLVDVLDLENPDLWKWLSGQEQPPEALKTNPTNPREASSTMASATQPKSLSFLFFLLLLVIPLNFPLMTKTLVESASDDPAPAAWPHQFHSVLFMNNSKGALQIVDLWYDWPKGRNFNIIQSQLGKLTYDLEWDNGTSFIYTLDANKECKTLHFPVGILRPNWLDGATYLGQRHVDGFLCNVWEKVDFIWYYEDVLTKRPVHWVFYTGFNAHVMTFEVGAVLEDAKWEAPVYCFGEEAEAERSRSSVLESMASHHSHGSLMRAGFRAT